MDNSKMLTVENFAQFLNKYYFIFILDFNLKDLIVE